MFLVSIMWVMCGSPIGIEFNLGRAKPSCLMWIGAMKMKNRFAVQKLLVCL
jgi:hypothetical protein